MHRAKQFIDDRGRLVGLFECDQPLADLGQIFPALLVEIADQPQHFQRDLQLFRPVVEILRRHDRRDRRIGRHLAGLWSGRPGVRARMDRNLGFGAGRGQSRLQGLTEVTSAFLDLIREVQIALPARLVVVEHRPRAIGQQLDQVVHGIALEGRDRAGMIEQEVENRQEMAGFR